MLQEQLVQMQQAGQRLLLNADPIYTPTKEIPSTQLTGAHVADKVDSRNGPQVFNLSQVITIFSKEQAAPVAYSALRSEYTSVPIFPATIGNRFAKSLTIYLQRR